MEQSAWQCKKEEMKCLKQVEMTKKTAMIVMTKSTFLRNKMHKRIYNKHVWLVPENKLHISSINTVLVYRDSSFLIKFPMNVKS